MKLVKMHRNAYKHILTIIIVTLQFLQDVDQIL